MLKHFFRAVSPLVLDAVGVIVFAILLEVGISLVAATTLSTVLGCLLVGWELVRGRQVPALQWLSLALVLMSAAATLLTGDARFVMVKPSLVYAAIGAAMLQRGWMLRYVGREDLPLVGDMMVLFGYVWAALMFLTAVANLMVALAFTAYWPLFLATFPLGSKIALFALQFPITYAVGRKRALAQQRAGMAPVSAASHA